MEVTSFFAILLSPVIAVCVSIAIQNRKEKRQQRLFIFSSLMSTRHLVVSDEIVRALNMIDVVFCDKKKIRDLWKAYYDMLSNAGLNNPEGWRQRDIKRVELITEMAKEVGLGKEVTFADVNRVYMPTGLIEDIERKKEIERLQLQLLAGSQRITLPSESNR